MKNIFTFLLILFTTSLYAQSNKGTLRGTILDNKTGEQIADDYSYVRTFIQDATMQIRMWSSTGFSISIINDKDVSVRLYVNDKYLQTVKIQNVEFDGEVN